MTIPHPQKGTGLVRLVPMIYETIPPQPWQPYSYVALILDPMGLLFWAAAKELNEVTIIPF